MLSITEEIKAETALSEIITKAILSKAASIIRKPENWTRGTFAKDKNDEQVSPEDPTATKCCIMGALRKAREELNIPIGNYTRKAEVKIETVLIGKGLTPVLPEFNDDPKTTHEDVIHILKETIAKY